MGGQQNTQTPLGCMLKSFKKGFSGDYGIEMTPQKLRTFCEIEWPSFGVEWPAEGSLDRDLIRKVYLVVTGSPSHPGQFPYIDSWEAIARTRTPWLKSCLENQSRILLSRTIIPSQKPPKEKNRRTEARPIFRPRGNPTSLFAYVPTPSVSLRAASPTPSTTLASSTSYAHQLAMPSVPPSLSPPPLPTTPIPEFFATPPPPVLTRYGPTDKRLQMKGPEAGALQLPLQETRGPVYYDQEGQVQGGRRNFVASPSQPLIS